MSNDLVRFSVAMPEGLLMEFDQLVARRGLAKNRSEVVRDLVRDALVDAGFDVTGVVESPITGPEGNVEYLVRAVFSGRGSVVGA